MTTNLTIVRATRILTNAGLLPSPRITIRDNKLGRVKHNRVACIEVSAGKDADSIMSSIEAALATAGFRVGWFHMADGTKQTAWSTAA